MDLTPKIPNLLRTPPLPAPDPVRPAASLEQQRSWKLVVFDVLTVLLAGAVGYSCLLYFSGGINFALFLALAGSFLLTSFFDFLLTRNPRRRAVLALLQILAFLAFFYAVKLSAVSTALLILVVFYFLADRGAMAVSENSLKFRLWPLARVYMKKIFVGFALAAIVLYLPQWNSGSVFVSDTQFQKWYDGVASTAHWFYSGIDFKSSLGAFAESIARVGLATNAQFKSLSAQQQDQAVHMAGQQLLANATKDIGYPLTPGMSLAEAFYRYLLNLFSHFKAQFGESFLAAWAVALFAIIWSIGTIFIWGVVLVAYILYEVLMGMNVVRLAGETRTKEIVELA